MDIVILIACGVVSLIILYVGWFQWSVLDCEREARFIFENNYRPKLTGSNRFVMNELLLQQMFPEKSQNVVRKVWINLVNSKVIVQDPMDGSWCLK